MAKGKEFETIISIAGRVEASLKKSLNDVSRELDQMQDAVKAAASATDKLAITIDDQGSELSKAKRKYMDYILAGEKSSKQAKQLKSHIERLSGELRDNKSKMAAAENAANQLGGELDDLGASAKNSSDGLSTMDVAIGNLAARGIEAIAGKAMEAGQAIYGLAEKTREYREDMGKLETAWESAGKSTELATGTYKQFYSVLGEEDRSVEAVNHLAKFVDTEKDMQKWTNIAAGVWGTFGDSLPIEGLTEASNETAKTGKVTGVLADALNWAGVSEDTFNEALEGMNSEQERAAYITETLNGLYSKAGDNYRENNKSIIDARLAQSDYNDTLAAMGEKMEPVTTAVTGAFNQILTKALEVMDGIDFTAIAEQIGDLTTKAIDLAVNGIGWLKDNANWLIPVISGLTAAFAAYKIISAGVAIYEGIKTAALATGTVVTGAASAATWTLGAAMAFLTSPIFLVVAAIAAVVAIGVALYKNWDTVKEKAAQLGAWLSNVWSNIKTAASNAWTSVTTAISNAWGRIKAGVSAGAAAVRSFVSNTWNNIKQGAVNAWTSVTTAISNAWSNIKGRISAAASAVRSAISNAWNAVKTTTSNIWTGITSAISNAWSNIKAKVSSMVSGVKTAITNGFNTLKTIMTKPFQSVIDIVDKVKGKIGSITDKVKNVGSSIGNKVKSLIPGFSSGGFTEGLSFAGEAGTEAVISFDRRYREQNLGYWAQAGRMLGADFTDFALSGDSGGTYYDLGGVTFSPNIVIHGQADRQTVMEAIEAEYPEFMVEEYLRGRERTVYA